MAEIIGRIGGQLPPPPQFNKTWKLSIEVGNFEGEFGVAMKKRVAVEKERVPILNEQKWSRSSPAYFYVFLFKMLFLSVFVH